VTKSGSFLVTKGKICQF